MKSNKVKCLVFSVELLLLERFFSVRAVRSLPIEPFVFIISTIYFRDLHNNFEGVKFSAIVKQLPRPAFGHAKILLSICKFFIQFFNYL